jgi:hypothetical protein
MRARGPRAPRAAAGGGVGRGPGRGVVGRGRGRGECLLGHGNQRSQAGYDLNGWEHWIICA